MQPRPIPGHRDQALVKFIDLVVRKDLNGKKGRIEGWLTARGRYDVLVVDEAEMVAVKPQNLVATSEVGSPVLVGKDVSKEAQHPASTVIDVQNLKKTSAPAVA